MKEKTQRNLGNFGLLLAVSLWVGPFSLAQGDPARNDAGKRAEAKDNPSNRMAGQNVPARQEGTAAASPPEVDLRALKDQLQVFQGILNRGIQQTFEQPFTLLQDAKGIYLPNFGVVFHLEINLHPLRLLSPFDLRPYTPEELRKARESKLERIRQLKNRLSELLLEHGGGFSAVPPEQNVAVVVHLFNLPSEQSDGLPTQLVIGTSRRALLDSQSQRLTLTDFQKREFFLEF